MKEVVLPLILCLAPAFIITGCGKVHAQGNADAATTGAPPPAVVEQEFDVNHFKVDHPDHFPVTVAGEYASAPELNVTGVVSPDVSRQVPVPSLTTGRIVEIDARLGDHVTKGQVLFKVRSSDIAGAYSNYLQAVKSQELAIDNERLTTIQLNRAKTLFEDGAYPRSALEIAENAEVGTKVALENAKVVTSTAKEQLGLYGVDPDHPSGIVSVSAPVSGTITDQEITNQAAVQSYSTPTPFTISDMSRVWIMCDVYENDLDQVHLNEYADIRLNAYPDQVLKGRISNILPVMDPNIRTAKVRLELDNPGLMRLGMFVTAAFHGLKAEKHATVPSAAIVHLHDREWVYTPAEPSYFRRIEVVSGMMLPDGMQEVVSGIQPGQRVVTNALILQDTSEK